MKKQFGTYKPGKDVAHLQILRALGLSRGIINKWTKRRWRELGYETVDATIRGICYRLNIKDNTTDLKILSSSKFYEKKEIKSLLTVGSKAAPEDLVFVDIGANTGYYSLTLSNLGFSKVLAIEPNPSTIELLKENIRFNPNAQEISIAPYCVGEEGFVDFFQSGGLGSASVMGQDHKGSTPIQVLSKPLLEILKEHKISRVDALKIDIEGYEDRALLPFFETSERKLWPRVIVIESCHSSSWKVDIIEAMVNIGYSMDKKSRANSILKLSNPT